MANAREIKSRISSVQDTMKITNAMYMISSSKMKKAKKILSDTEPYFYNMQGAIARILRHIPDIQHPFFSVRHLIPREERKIATIVVTGDKGMAGAYNHNITRMTEEIIASTPGYHKLYVLGMVGRQYFGKKDVDMDGSFRYTVQKPTMHRARLISEEAVDVLKEELFPLADLLTPNIPETEVLTGRKIKSADDMIEAAKQVSEQYHCAVLCKGGHKLNDANDLLYEDGTYQWFEGKRIDNPNTHGTGCTLSSAIASRVACANVNLRMIPTSFSQHRQTSCTRTHRAACCPWQTPWQP